MPLRIPCWALTCLLLALAPVSADDTGQQRLPQPGTEVWRPITFRGIDRHTRYELVDPTAVLRAQSESTLR